MMMMMKIIIIIIIIIIIVAVLSEVYRALQIFNLDARWK